MIGGSSMQPARGRGLSKQLGEQLSGGVCVSQGSGTVVGGGGTTVVVVGGSTVVGGGSVVGTVVGPG